MPALAHDFVDEDSKQFCLAAKDRFSQNASIMHITRNQLGWVCLASKAVGNFGILLGSALVFLSFSLMAQIPEPGSEGKIRLQWMSDHAAALKKAEAEKKPLLIDITTDWCGWSKKMERETFADKAVQKELRSFVLLRINPEASDENDKLAKNYGVDGYPTLAIVNYRGEQLGGTSGYLDTKEMLEFLKRYLPIFKSNPLGYKPVTLDSSDPLMKAIACIPKPDARPRSVGSFVVLDQCNIELQANGKSKFLVRTATFVADPEKEDLPQAERQYVSSRQKLKFKSVRILNAKGEGREVDLKLAKDEHAYSNQNVYWDVRRLSLPLPALKEGQILDVIEEMECEPIMPNQFYFRWNTGTRMLLSSDITITFPPSIKLQKQAIRCPTEVSETKNSNGTTTWELKTSNPTPYEPAIFSPAFTEIWEGYDFYTPCTKDALATWYAKLCQDRDVLPESAKSKVAELKRDNSTQTALLQAILDWVTKDVRYVSVAFGASSHQPHRVGDTLTDRYGDCKDQSLLVKALCREAGISASLVLMSSFGDEFNEDCPAIEQFNHCIVEAVADGKTFHLDPAAGKAKLGRLPPAYSAAKVLVLDETSARVAKLPAYEPLTESCVETVVKLNANASGTVTENELYTGMRAEQMKERMKETTPQKVRKYIEDSYKKSGRKLLEFSMPDTNSPSDKYETHCVYTVPRFGSLTAGGLVFKLGAQGRDNDWIASLNQPRTQAFRFRASDVSTRVYTVELPPQAVLKSKPENLTLNTPFLKANREIAFKDNKLTVTETYTLLDAKLGPAESNTVYEAFRKLHDHQDYAFIVELPSKSAAAESAQQDEKK